MSKDSDFDPWYEIVQEYGNKIDKKYKDKDGNLYSFFGLVHASDDYYYGLWDFTKKRLLLTSCVGRLEEMYDECVLS